MKTISEILKTTKAGDILTNGKLRWIVKIDETGEKIAFPLTKKSFELWENCTFEKVAVIPGLRIMK